MAKVGYAKIGFFIVSAIVLGCGLLLFLGLSDIFVQKVTMESFFNESVQGLSVGSAVKYKGVSVGTVSHIAIRTDDQVICVTYELRPRAFRNRNETDAFDAPYELVNYMQQEVAKGLRCRLDYAGITGMRYLELDYYAEPQTLSATKEKGILEIPTEPSVFKDIAKSLNSSLERIARIRFEEISDSLVDSLRDMNELLSAPDVKDSLSNIQRISKNLDETSTAISKVVTEKRLVEISNSLEQNLQQLSTLTKRIEDDLEAAELAKSSQSVREAANAITAGAEVVISQKQQVTQSISKFNRMIDAMRSLLEILIDDPSAVVSGRRQE